MNIIHFDSIDSTNNYGKKLIRSGEFTHGTLIVAERQTCGRGRFDRSFYSEGGLYMSILLDARHMTFPLTCAAAVAVHDTVLNLFGINLSVKWVNDLLFDKKKVCGILAEAVCDEKGLLAGFVCGIGLNTKDTHLPSFLQKTATVLPVSNKNLAPEIAKKLLFLYDNCTDVVPLYKEILLLDIPVDVYQGEEFLFSGYAYNINSSGNLLVSNGEKRYTLTSGEISIKLT